MIRRLPSISILSLLFLLLLLPSTPASASDLSAAGYHLEAPLTPEIAESMIQSLPLSAPEGIWYDPIDNMTLLILKDLTSTNAIGVFILLSDDCRLQPGMRLGTLTPTADPKLFSLSLLSRFSPKKGLHLPLDATAKTNSDFSRISIEVPKLKFSLTPSIIIPNLIDMLRLRVNIRYSNPNDKLHDGWIKISPNMPSDYSIIYL